MSPGALVSSMLGEARIWHGLVSRATVLDASGHEPPSISVSVYVEAFAVGDRTTIWDVEKGGLTVGDVPSLHSNPCVFTTPSGITRFAAIITGRPSGTGNLGAEIFTY